MGNSVRFSVNSYDRDGDIVEPGIFLHFGNLVGGTRVKVADDIEGFKQFISRLESMVTEISENWI